MTMYGQDLISSTLEPFQEFMPSNMQEIDTRSQRVQKDPEAPYLKILEYLNEYIWDMRCMPMPSTSGMDKIAS